MSYSDFGLDVNKVSTENGVATRSFYCPWTRLHVTGKNFYLCFSNWVISRPAIRAFQHQPPECSDPGDQCIKCRQPVSHLHYTAGEFVFAEGTRLGICQECVDLAVTYTARIDGNIP